MLKKKEIASLLNVTVYTYQGYEQGCLDLPGETVWLISKIYGIDKNDILCKETDISNQTKRMLIQLSDLTKEQRYQYFVETLTGTKKGKIGYREIEEIKRAIRQKMTTNTLK